MLRFNESTWPGPAEVLRPERSLNGLVESDGESFCGSVIPAGLTAPPPQETRPAMLDLPNRRKPAHQVSRDRLAIQRPGRTPPQIGARGARGVPARHGRPILQGCEIDMMKAPAPRTTMPFLGPYYYGKHKWDNYLLDIQETLESGNAAHRQNIRLQSGTLDVARKQVEELRQQTEQLSNIEQALQNGFEGLRAEFEWGFTLMVDRMDTQINLLSKVAEELDAIHQTLKSPLINQAQELFRLGEQHFNEGLWDKALKDFLESEKKERSSSAPPAPDRKAVPFRAQRQLQSDRSARGRKTSPSSGLVCRRKKENAHQMERTLRSGLLLRRSHSVPDRRARTSRRAP